MGIYSEDFTVVVVEDDQAQRKLINRVLLKIKGVHPVLCADVFEAFALIRAKQQVDLLMLDIHLPFTSGISLLQKLRSLKEYKKFPILISTAECDLPGEVVAEANGVLYKPYDVSEIKKFVVAIQRT